MFNMKWKKNQFGGRKVVGPRQATLLDCFIGHKSGQGGHAFPPPMHTGLHAGTGVAREGIMGAYTEEKVKVRKIITADNIPHKRINSRIPFE